MKFLAIILALAPTLALAAPAATQSTTTKSYYDNRGSFAGQSWTRGNSTSFSDGQGRLSGTSIRHGNQTATYDGSGRYTGSIIHTGTLNGFR